MSNNKKPRYNEIVFSSEQLEDIKELYLHGTSSVKIGKKYNVSYRTILRTLNKLGVEISHSNSIRKYSINEHYFDEIDTPNKAYILGFLYADGSNSMGKGTVSMALEECDRHILESIRKELNSQKELEYLDYSNKSDFGYSYKNQYRLNLFSIYMCK